MAPAAIALVNPRFLSDAHWAATSGQTIAGSVWSPVFAADGPTHNFDGCWISRPTSPIEERKGKLETGWWKLVKRYGLRDDPATEPFQRKEQ